LLRDAAISLSLANLCFVKVWSRVLSSAGSYFNEFPIVYVSLIADVVLLAACFWIGITLVRRSRFEFLARIYRWSFLLALLTAANAIATLLITFLPRSPVSVMGRSWANAAAIALTLTTVFLVFIWRARHPGSLSVCAPHLCTRDLETRQLCSGGRPRRQQAGKCKAGSSGACCKPSALDYFRRAGSKSGVCRATVVRQTPRTRSAA
jgi:hypothetical protein